VVWVGGCGGVVVVGGGGGGGRAALCERLGIEPEDFISLASDPLQDHAWLEANGLVAGAILQITRPGARPRKVGAVCLICRSSENPSTPCAADYCINSMADLVAQHQLSLRR